MRALLATAILALGVPCLADPTATVPSMDVFIPSDLVGPPEPTADDRYAQGLMREATGDLAMAEEAYRDAVALRPEFPEGWHRVGHLQKRRGRFAEAAVACRRATLQRAQFAAALECLGESYVGLGRLAEARETLARLRPLDGSLAATLARTIAGSKRPEGQ